MAGVQRERYNFCRNVSLGFRFARTSTSRKLGTIGNAGGSGRSVGTAWGKRHRSAASAGGAWDTSRLTAAAVAAAVAGGVRSEFGTGAEGLARGTACCPRESLSFSSSCPRT